MRYLDSAPIVIAIVGTITIALLFVATIIKTKNEFRPLQEQCSRWGVKEEFLGECASAIKKCDGSSPGLYIGPQGVGFGLPL